jgi:ABC-type multidrug transport system permease subunit
VIESVNNFLRNVYVLTMARNKEFYRDRGVMIWSLLFPFLIVAAIGFAFSGGEQTVFKIGVYAPAGKAAPDIRLLAENYVNRVVYDDFEQALKQLRNFQVDLLLSAEQPDQYWMNEGSPGSRAVEQLLLAMTGFVMQRQAVTGREIRYVDWVIPGVLGMNLMFGCLFGIGYVIVRYRKNGVLKRIQVTPVTPLQFLTAQVLSRLLVMVVVSVIIYAGCDLFLDFIMLGSYLDLCIIALLGIFAMIAFALIVASRTASEELANGLLNIATFPMLLLSEVWFSLDEAPDWLIFVSQLLPLTHAVQAAREIMLNGAGLASQMYHVWVLIGMSVVFLGISSVLFRWNEQ